LYQVRIYPAGEALYFSVATEVINLVVGLPALLGPMWLARRGRLVGLLCWPGALLHVLYIHVKAIYGKLNVNNRTKAIEMARQLRVPYTSVVIAYPTRKPHFPGLHMKKRQGRINSEATSHTLPTEETILWAKRYTSRGFRRSSSSAQTTPSTPW
jgi:hypothetical protein